MNCLAEIFPLTSEQKETFLRDGILVVDNVLSKEEVVEAQEGLHQTLRDGYGVDHKDLMHTAANLTYASSTNGSGGILDIYYPPWKMKLATNRHLLSIVCQLWELIRDGQEDFQRHPYGYFDVNKAYVYIDRVGYRIPTKLSEAIVQNYDDGNAKCDEEKRRRQRKNHKRHSIQRSLTPHLDCCPQTVVEQKIDGKWRPIQSFISLTDNLEPHTGGFEAAPGFHRQFNQWANNRSLPPITRKHNNGSKLTNYALCIGQYTHIRPVEDHDVLSQIKHVPCRSGSAVLWDYRIPHGNSYRNDSNIPREVVYASFLPDVPVNRIYIQNQLKDYLQRKLPTDQWIHRRNSAVINSHANTTTVTEEKECTFPLTTLEKKLMGIEDW